MAAQHKPAGPKLADQGALARQVPEASGVRRRLTGLDDERLKVSEAFLGCGELPEQLTDREAARTRHRYLAVLQADGLPPTPHTPCLSGSRHA